MGCGLPVFRERGVRRHSQSYGEHPDRAPCPQQVAGRVRHSGTAAQLGAVAAVQDQGIPGNKASRITTGKHHQIRDFLGSADSIQRYCFG